MNDAFRESATDEQVLFNLPITKDFLRQIVLGTLLICKASYRDVQMFLHDVFDTSISIGTIANTHNNACLKAVEIVSDDSLVFTMLVGFSECSVDEVVFFNLWVSNFFFNLLQLLPECLMAESNVNPF